MARRTPSRPVDDPKQWENSMKTSSFSPTNAGTTMLWCVPRVTGHEFTRAVQNLILIGLQPLRLYTIHRRRARLCTTRIQRRRRDDSLAHPQASECEAAGVGLAERKKSSPSGAAQSKNIRLQHVPHVTLSPPRRAIPNPEVEPW
jgi:hypothetical protein